jgi:hypothetical protein
VGDLPEIQFFSLYAFIKTPKEIDGLSSLGIFLPTKHTKQWKEVPFKSLFFKWKKVEKGEGPTTCGFSLIVEKRPNPKGILLEYPLAIFS